MYFLAQKSSNVSYNLNTLQSFDHFMTRHKRQPVQLPIHCILCWSCPFHIIILILYYLYSLRILFNVHFSTSNIKMNHNKERKGIGKPLTQTASKSRGGLDCLSPVLTDNCSVNADLHIKPS